MAQPPRTRRTRQDIRAQLIDAALVEFAEFGFEGASTRSIARRIDAHQPQINYHFESKEALWTAAVDHLFAQLRLALGPLATTVDAPADIDLVALAGAFADGIRGYVRFAAAHPELNRIMIHEGTVDTERLRWMTATHVQPIYDAIRPVWRRLRDAGIAAPVDDELFHYVLVGAVSLPYVQAPEARLLTGRDPFDPDVVERHADSVVAMLLPKLGRRER